MPLALGLQAQMGTGFLKGHFHCPAAHAPLQHLPRPMLELRRYESLGLKFVLRVPRSCTCSLRIIHQPRRQVAYRRLIAMLKERDGMRSALSRDTPGRAAWSGSDLVWNMATEPTSARPRGAEACHAGQAALQRQATLCWADDKAPR